MASATITPDPLLRFLDELLELVEEGAPLERLNEARANVRAGLGSAVAREQLDAIYERSLRLREAQAERHHREMELGVLVATAADLSALHDLDDVLAAICSRVRSLLGTDAAWITLVDPVRGDTYHCMTDGIVAEEQVRGHRLSVGTGLGGLVMESGRAEWTQDYLADRRFAHTPSIDRSAIDEGLGAMLGAPMKRGDELLGIVITANRGHRRFTAQHVTLLQTLADHAAIAIANARAMSAHEDAKRSAALRTRLSELVLDGIDLHELLVPVAELLEGHVMVVDANRRVLATAGDEAGATLTDARGFLEVSALPSEVEAALDEVMTTGRPAAVALAGRLIAPMLARREPVGALMLTKQDPVESDLRLIESAALPLALFLANARAQADAERAVRGELLDDLIAGTLPTAALARRARDVGWDHEAEHVLAVVDAGADDKRWIRLSASRLAAERGGLVGERDGQLVLLLPGDDAQAAGAAVFRALQRPAVEPPTVAVARPAIGHEHVPASCAEARRALALSLALGRRGTTVLTETPDAFGLIFGGTEPEQLAAFIERTLGPVLAHDRDRQAGLIATLDAWFECEGHMGNTASRAHVHVNTLYKRMERIDELLGAGWRQSDQRLQVQLALRLRALAENLGPVTP